MEFIQVAPGVYSAAHDFVDGRNAVVVGDRKALAVDAGNYAADGQAMADFVRAQGHAADYLALTHGHGDHVLGAAPLLGGEVFAHELTPGVIERQIPGWVERQGRSREEIVRDLPWPTVTFSDQLRLDLGGKTAWLFPTPGHSEDGVSVLVEPDRVLIGGDAVVTGIVPAIGDGDSRVLEASLRRLAEIEIRVLVPGHGAEVHGVEAARAWILWEADYLARVRQSVDRLLGEGRSAAEAGDAIDFATYIGDRLPADRNSMPKRHRATVDKIIQEQTESDRL